jgi:hypothetical protein
MYQDEASRDEWRNAVTSLTRSRHRPSRRSPLNSCGKSVTSRLSQFLYAHSVTALILALGIGSVIGVMSWLWSFLSIVVVAGFSCLAVLAWRDTMGMLRFQAQRALSVRQRPVMEEE